MGEPPARYIWTDGEIVPWAEARLHVDTGCVLGGLNAYEVAGAFWSPADADLLLFRLDEHFDRLERSAKIMRLLVPYSRQELTDAACELLRRNQFREDVLIRFVCYFGEGVTFGYLADEVRTGVFMIAKPIPPNPPFRRGIHLGTSIWNRLPDTSAPPRVKAGANYQNARLAHIQARVDGYDDALFRNAAGKIAELPLANFFLVRNGTLITPATSAGILEGITRLTILDVCREDLAIPVVERDVDYSEVHSADEAFACGTGREVFPVLSIDRYVVGNGTIGPITDRVQDYLLKVVHGEVARRRAWCRPVTAGAGVAPRS